MILQICKTKRVSKNEKYFNWNKNYNKLVKQKIKHIKK